MVFDMSAVIHMIKPQHAKVFGDYTQMHLLPFLEGQISTPQGSMQSGILTKKAVLSHRLVPKGVKLRSVRRTTRVSAKIPVPKGAEWHKFLKESLNKDQLFQFLSEELIKILQMPDLSFTQQNVILY
ncbi:MAG: hypothetical protein GY702_27760 [Desulfobulbaceae bacterium]|nr:hypothetical protein [Desulfobulbaceae bacterium]